MNDCRDYREILPGESLGSNDSSSDISGEATGETLGSQDTWSSDSQNSSSSQDSFLVSSDGSQDYEN